jgi:AcrR family transcriptional regulator
LLKRSYGAVVSRRRKHERRTQAERTAATRSALLDAAVGCIAELGYARTTTTEVARRAGVSRGAQLHHFPTKADLLLAATAQLCDRRLADFRTAFAGAPAGTDPIDTAIDVMWSMYADETFTSHVELLVAARTDDTLRQAMVDQQQLFFDGAAVVFTEILGDSLAAEPASARLNLAFAFSLMDGVALKALLGGPYPILPVDVIDALKAVAHLVLEPTPEEPP